MANRIRVYEVAKELGVDSKEVIDTLAKDGVVVKNQLAAVTDEQAASIRQKLGKPKPAAQGTAPRVTQKPAQQQVQKPAQQTQKPAQGAQRSAQQTQRPAQQAQRPAQQAQRPAQQTPRPAQQTQRPAQQTQRPAQQASERPAPKVAAEQPRVVGSQRAPARRQSTPPRTGGQQGRQQTRPGQRTGDTRGRQSSYGRDRRAKPAPVQQPVGARRVTIQGPIPVRELAVLVGLPAAHILRALMGAGMLISINQNVPAEIAVKIAEKLGCVVTVKEPEKSQEEIIAAELERVDDPEVSVSRPPVVTVMGHVDHGKTSLLDAMRDTNVTAKEAGGITQHMGASVVEHQGSRIIFLDTPGHEAFTAMRARGARVTDLAVLVVAADDGVMPQTIEAINHSKAAGVPIIVAMNKMDKPTARPDRVKQQLADAGLVAEDWGGDTVVVPVSARTKEGVDDLLEMIVLVAEMQEITTDPTRKGRGYIIESQMDKGKGPVATALIRSGSLRVGDIIITDTTWGRIRMMFDSHGRRVRKAGPHIPVEIAGFDEVPEAGDMFLVVDDEKVAKDVNLRRKTTRRARELESQAKPLTLEELFRQREESEARTDLYLIVKCDVQGSLEAILQALAKIQDDEVKLNVIHSGVGAVIESDIMLARASGNATVLGFNVRPDPGARALAEEQGIQIRTYRVIYELLDDVNAMLKGLLKPKTEEAILGRAEVRQIFHVPRAGTVAGCYVPEGKITRQSSVRLIRDSVIVYEGKMSSLRRFKDDVSEVLAGYECGIGLDRFQDIKPGDIIEAFTMKEVQ